MADYNSIHEGNTIDAGITKTLNFQTTEPVNVDKLNIQQVAISSPSGIALTFVRPQVYNEYTLAQNFAISADETGAQYGTEVELQIDPNGFTVTFSGAFTIISGAWNAGEVNIVKCKYLGTGVVRVQIINSLNLAITDYYTQAQVDAKDANVLATIRAGVTTAYDDLEKIEDKLNEIGDLSTLTTSDQTSIVNAINELVGGVAFIDDAVTVLTKTWSSSKISTELVALKNEILGGAGAAYDTLQELKDYLDSVDTSILTALANRVRVDAAQPFTSGQQQQARDNIDVYSTAEVDAFVTPLQTATNEGTGLWVVAEGSWVDKDAGNSDNTALEVNDIVYFKEIANGGTPVMLVGYQYDGGDKSLLASYTLIKSIMT